ncbi:microcystin-dependent protein [Litorimonas taeanensis]|uniref:Microcystin-dependent protein n=1 Tax=Litorimonas taeanensis TaxID=568099 RepID=A0A420WLA7_9PROT|nr:tail fiber protein [Litorimonas taeanensis]RKQ71770.1 microcystin-dependent protein [Litorimonas taeanensis]
MTIKSIVLSGAVLLGALSIAQTASAVDRYVGEVILVGFNFCPRGTAAADGQLLAIDQNSSLFALYGTTYGGDGRTVFGLPDLRGRTVVGDGTGPGLTSRRIGARGGVETVKNLPKNVATADGDSAQQFTEGSEQNMQPFQVMKYCVVTNGIFPSRN